MTQKTVKIPVRQCLGCNEHKPKNQLLRIVRDPDNNISLDFTGKKSGRGAYICKDIKCLRKVRKSHRADSILGCVIPEEVYDKMEAEIAASEDSK